MKYTSMLFGCFYSPLFSFLLFNLTQIPIPIPVLFSSLSIICVCVSQIQFNSNQSRDFGLVQPSSCHIIAIGAVNDLLYRVLDQFNKAIQNVFNFDVCISCLSYNKRNKYIIICTEILDACGVYSSDIK